MSCRGGCAQGEAFEHKMAEHGTLARHPTEIIGHSGLVKGLSSPLQSESGRFVRQINIVK